MPLFPNTETQSWSDADSQEGGFYGDVATPKKSTSLLDSALNLLDPSKARLSIAGLLTGGSRTNRNQVTNIGFNKSIGSNDWRVRVSLADSARYFYNNQDRGILAPLFSGSTNNNGVIFPYTPQIQVQHTARYGSTKLTHSNYDSYFYEGSEVQAITITGEFTVQNTTEADYLLAAVYFFRACTKMWFGQGERAGNPPPIVYLDGYGAHYFPHVSCVITNFSHTMPQDVDYIETVVNGGATRLPTTSSMSVTLQPVVSRSKATGFNLDDFARGNLLRNRGGFI
jgi:hypothetical protein